MEGFEESWRGDGSVELDMNSTLEENGIADETKIFEKMQMVSANFVPVLYLHLTDSLSMHQNT